MSSNCVYGVYDSIAEKWMGCFHAQNDADARRYVRLNFSKTPLEVLEGFQVHQMVAPDYPAFAVLDVMPPGPLKPEA